MLKVKAFTQKCIEDIFSDTYIPLKIRFGPTKAVYENLIYWSCGDNRNIIEIGIKEQSRELYSITLVNFSNFTLQEYSCPDNISNSNGCPIFEMNDCKDGYITVEAEIKVYIGQNNVTVIFDSRNIESCVKNNNIVFFLDENKNLIGFKFETNDVCHNNLLAQTKI